MKFRKLLCTLLTAVLSVCGLSSAISVTAAAALVSVKCTLFYNQDYTALKAETANAGDKLYYTIDGSDPDTSSALYKKKLGFVDPATVKIAEFDAAGNRVSKIKTVVIQRILPKPKLLVKDKFDGTAEVQITCEKEGAKIHYTTNGKTPTESSPVLEGYNLLVKGDREIKAIAVLDGWKSSDVASIKPLDLVTEDSYEEYVKKCLELVNAERAKKGLYALKLNEKLNAAALVRAKELSSNYENGHTRPNGQRWTTALKEAGYIHRYASENYGKLDRTGVNPELIMELWMESDAHRDAIFNTLGKEVGMGFYQVDGYCYWIQLYGELM